MHPKWSERRAAREKKLHEMLKLTPSQNAAWTTYLGAAQPMKQPGERMARGVRRAMAAPKRMEQRVAMAKQRVARMETELAALNTLYAVLTPEQKGVFDAQAKGHGKHGRQMGGHRMRHAQPG